MVEVQILVPTMEAVVLILDKIMVPVVEVVVSIYQFKLYY